jgi:hypothetical protein
MNKLTKKQAKHMGQEVNLVGHIRAPEGRCWMGDLHNGFWIETGLDEVHGSIYTEVYHPMDLKGPVVKSITIEFPMPDASRDLLEERAFYARQAEAKDNED